MTYSFFPRSRSRSWMQILVIAPLLGALSGRPALAAIATDVNISADANTAATSVVSPPFSTTSPNELLLAFVATDGITAGITVTSITTPGLTWSLVRRTNVQLGTAEIWRAFAPATLGGVTVQANLSQKVASSLTVIGFTGVDISSGNGASAIGATGTGNARPGAPTASLVTTRANSWVWGVGDDWDKPILRTPGPNQSIVHTARPPAGDT